MPPARRRSSACGCSPATACTSKSRTEGASSSRPRLQAEQHLEGGTAYRQVRPTRLDKIENLRSEASADVLAVDCPNGPGARPPGSEVPRGKRYL